MSNLLLQKIVLLRVTEVVKIILKKKRPLLLARSVDKKCCVMFNGSLPPRVNHIRISPRQKKLFQAPRGDDQRISFGLIPRNNYS